MAGTATPALPQSGDDLGFVPVAQQGSGQQDSDLGFTPVAAGPAPSSQPYSMPDGRLIDPATHSGGIPNPHAIAPTQSPSQPTASVSAAPPPTLFERARQYLSETQAAKNLHRLGQEAYGFLGGGAGGGDAAPADTPQEMTDQYLQRTAGANSPYKPIAAVGNMAEGFQNIAQGAGTDDPSKVRFVPTPTGGIYVPKEMPTYEQAKAGLDQEAHGATQVMQGGMELSKPLVATGIAKAPVKAAIYFGTGILAGKGTAAVAQEMNATPNEVEFFKTAGFFISSVLTGLASVRTAEIPEGVTVADPVTGEQVPVRGSAVAGKGFTVQHAVTDTGEHVVQGRVGPYSASVRFGRTQPGTAPEAPAASPSLGQGEVLPPAPSQPPDAVAVQQRAQQATVAETAASAQTINLKAAQIAGLAPPPPPPPKPGEPGSKEIPLPAGMDNGQLSQQVVEDAGKAIQAVPPSVQPKAILEATGNLAKWMFGQKTFVGPDGKVVNVDSQKAAQTEAVNLINNEVDRQNTQKQEADKARQDQQDAQDKALEKQQKDAETAAQEREEARQAAEANEVQPLPNTPQMQKVRAALNTLPPDATKADVILAARKAAATVKLALPYKLANQLADEHVATRSQQEDAAVAGLTGEKFNPDQHPVALAKLATDVQQGETAFLHVQPGTKFKPAGLIKENGFVTTNVKKAQDPTFNGQYFHPAEIKSRDVQKAASGEAPLAALRGLEENWRASKSPAQEPENQNRAALSESPEQTQLGNPKPRTLETMRAEQKALRAQRGVALRKNLAETGEQNSPETDAMAEKLDALDKEMWPLEREEMNAKTARQREILRQFPESELTPAELQILRPSSSPFARIESDTPHLDQWERDHAETKAPEAEAKPAVVETEPQEPEPMDEVQLYREARTAALARGVNPESTEEWGTAIAEEEARILDERKNGKPEVAQNPVEKNEPVAAQVEQPEEKPAEVARSSTGNAQPQQKVAETPKSPTTFKPGQKVTIKSADGTQRTGEVRFANPGGKLVIKGERKPVAANDVSPVEAEKAAAPVKTDTDAVAPGTKPPSELEGWKQELAALKADSKNRYTKERTSEINDLSAKILDAEAEAHRTAIPLTEPEEKLVTDPDENKWKYQAEYFVKALEPAKEAWVDKYAGRFDWDSLKDERPAMRISDLDKPALRPEKFPDEFIHIEVPDDGKFLVKNTPAAIDRLLRSAPRAFAKPGKTTVPGIPNNPKGPKELDAAKLIQKFKAEIEETEQDLSRASTPDREFLQQKLKAARENLANAEQLTAEPKEKSSALATTFYSSPLDPELLKRYIGQPLMKMAAPLREALEKHGDIAEVAHTVDGVLRQIDKSTTATTLGMKAAVRAMADPRFTHEDAVQVFDAREDPAIRLTPKQTELRDSLVAPLNQATRQEYVIEQLIKSGKFSLDDILGGKVPEDEVRKLVPNSDNYQHRIAVGKDTLPERLVDENAQKFQAGGGKLSKTFSSEKARTFREIHGTNGEREAVGVKGDRVVQFVNKDNAGVLDARIADAKERLAAEKAKPEPDEEKNDNLQRQIDELNGQKQTVADGGRAAVDIGPYRSGFITTQEIADKAAAPLERQLDGMMKEWTILHASQKRAIASDQRIWNLYNKIDDLEKHIAAVRASVGPEEQAKTGLTDADLEAHQQSDIDALGKRIEKLQARQAKLQGTEGRSPAQDRELRNIPGHIAEAKETIDSIRDAATSRDLEGRYWQDKNGNLWKFDQGTAKFISERTGQDYFRDARLAELINHMEVDKAMNAAIALEKTKSLLEDAGMAVKVESAKNAPDGWKPTTMPQFRNYYFPEQIADTLDHFQYKQTRKPNVLTQANSALLQFILMNPGIHWKNIVAAWGTGKAAEFFSGKGLDPRWYADQVKAGTQAANTMRDIGGPEYQRVLRAGLDLRGADSSFDATMKDALRQWMDQLNLNPQHNAAVSALLGVKNAAKFFQKWNHELTFGAGDVATLQSFYAKRAELVRKGMDSDSAEAAAKDYVHQVGVGEYTTPARVAGSAKLGMMLDTPALNAFWPYHFGYLWRPLAKAIGDAVGPDRERFRADEEATQQTGETVNKMGQTPWEQRRIAIARLLFLTLWATQIQPYLNKKAKEWLGDLNAEFVAGGPTKLASDIYEAFLDQHNIGRGIVAGAAKGASELVMPSPGLRAAVGVVGNYDTFLGRHVYNPNGEPQEIGKEVGMWLLKGTYPAQIQGASVRGGWKQALEKFAGFNFPLHNGMKAAMDIRSDESGKLPPDPVKSRTFKAILAAAQQSHQSGGNDTTLADALRDSGKLSDAQRRELNEAITEAPIVFAVRGLEHPQDYWKVYEHSTDMEKSALMQDSETRDKISKWEKELRSEGKTDEADKIYNEIVK